MKIALVTYQDKGQYHTLSANEDAILSNYLQQKGVTVTREIWNSKEVVWEDYDLLILKSPWDYFNFVTDFYAWLDLIKSKNIRLLNPVDSVKWNADKHYLQDIEQAGLEVTPSFFVNKLDQTNLNSYFERFGTDKLIVKPCVSGGSKNTFKVTADNVVQINRQLEELVKVENFIVQPFIKEIEELGEWSFLFFRGNFSHAILKKAAEGDFRVQPMFGGTVHPQQPDGTLISVAKEYVQQFAKECLYARVDGVFIAGKFTLMELELIEPFLFLDTNENALENYYRALKSFM